MSHASLHGTSGDHRGSASCPELFYQNPDVSSSLRSHPALFDTAENRRLAKSPGLCNVSHTDYYEDVLGLPRSHSSEPFVPGPHMTEDSWSSVKGDDYARQHQGLKNCITGSLNIGLLPNVSPRRSFYMNYYEKTICPTTVAIDGPSNPYRQHTLSLAAESQSLQHAIYALASCSLRMRRKHNLGQHSWNQSSEDRQDFTRSYNPRRPSNAFRASETPLDDASVQEEYHHRSLAVSLLNAQLSSPSLAKHDAVLATLLILCHYRIFETGFATAPCSTPSTAHTPHQFLHPPPQTSAPTLEEIYKQYAQRFSSSTSTPYIESPTIHCSDPRIHFWTEWRTTRYALQKWTFSPSALLASLHPIVPSPDQIGDFGYVSEAFRHAALLYTERITMPYLPAGHITIQQHVRQVLFYVTSLGEKGVESCDAMGKFLLWPLLWLGARPWEKWRGMSCLSAVEGLLGEADMEILTLV
ncbi:hypothetical protein V494_00378 [Pseudogymnoascus sp. VKM F-4513 (FW-928)]|nr:hypothetical protein V490_05762 [Pseudogymnoascus sp. VKM F-3557]KFY46687.1 hypothetical protein V494_00378 [Pseudogymnoascus sp. VKM F-4513 (FW-928)]